MQLLIPAYTRATHLLCFQQIPKHSSPLTMPCLTNLNCSLTHWNSIQTSSELLISQQNLLPNLPFLEHLSGHRHRFPSSFQQYLEKINIALFVCFSLSSYTTEMLLLTRKQSTFPLSDQKRNNLPWKFMNQTALLPHILLGSKTRCVSASAAGIRHRRTLHADLVVYIQCTIPFLNTCYRRTKSQPSASSYRSWQHQPRPANKTFPSQWYRVRGSLRHHGLRRFLQSSLSVVPPSAILPSTHSPTQALIGPFF